MFYAFSIVVLVRVSFIRRLGGPLYLVSTFCSG